MEKENGLTGAEWNVMECLWASSPRTGREATEYLEKSVGWTKSTTLTMLRRMTEKGLIKCDGSGEVRLYSPLVAREDAAMRETGDFINRVYKGSVGLMMSAMTEKQMLTKDEIDELYAILKKAEEDGNA
jgi:BlaI family penicillinase repressor